MRLHVAGMNVATGEPVEPLGIPVVLSPQIHLAPAFAATWAEMLKKVSKGGSISDRSSLVVDGDAKLLGLELDGALVIRPSAGTSIKVDGLKETNAGWSLQMLQPGEDVPEEVALRGYKLVQAHSRTLAFSDGKERVVKA